MGMVLRVFIAEVRPVEIVGGAGLTGSGREEVAGLTIGRERRDAGTVTVNGASVRSGDPIGAMSAGMAWICGERARYGVFSTMSVGTNLTINSEERRVGKECVSTFRSRGSPCP